MIKPLMFALRQPENQQPKAHGKTDPRLRVFIHWRNPLSGKFYYCKKIGRTSGFRYKQRHGGRGWNQHQLQPVSFKASQVIGSSVREKPFKASEVIIAPKKLEFTARKH